MYHGIASTKEVMFLPALVCLFVCVSVCHQHYSTSYPWILMKFQDSAAIRKGKVSYFAAIYLGLPYAMHVE